MITFLQALDANSWKRLSRLGVGLDLMVLLHKLLLKEYLSYVLYRKTDEIVHSIALLIQRIAKDASVLYIVADGNNFPGKHVYRYLDTNFAVIQGILARSSAIKACRATK